MDKQEGTAASWGIPQKPMTLWKARAEKAEAEVAILRKRLESFELQEMNRLCEHLLKPPADYAEPDK